ncbi:MULTISPECIES: ubiquinol-cytochrome c reductase iron-sulfur subunit [unclassified Gordonia (in: high G+C Gram-positive bacteria)]|uniref:cytochrome bc1 complex Rieske iron-sulfur subunit n=1 Tax=Gordonia TaxID=2053 RepID=UPI0009913EFB|nr:MULTISPECIES: ubiquinol-cytochrome c reductase iron-sulfur subunit [unclassified Gordonia (in: high G+C Gram-positive bacteria)]MBR7192813.1 ubiquinol-cytochrome c reductase iron-sulfur subunit [Gordonia sp. SCSIO 19800]MCX2753452.1 ubiquinol-cytochrome c reductase iron-sulfur subunit [Gordonia sp. 4N]MDT0219519.1 ubiquinol-cytochrome c reductase iron-sulfur subunit [Gordonia sp. AC31]
MSANDKAVPSRDELEQMSTDELVKLGTNLDGVEIIHRSERYSVPGTKVEKRAERQVAIWFTVAGVSALACLGIFLFNHWEFALPDDPNYWWYTFNTPLLGVTFGLSVFAIGVALILITKKFIPAEISVQDRHDGGSAEVDKKTIVGLLQDTGATSTLGRRKMIIGSAGFGLGAFAVTGLVAFLGGFIKNPWAEGPDSPLWHSGWSPIYNPPEAPNETIYLRRDTGNPFQVALVRPEDLDAGGMETVFPWRRSDGFGESEHSRHLLEEGLHQVRNPVMLIRLRPEDAARAVKRKGQESFNYGDYFAYTKVCSHLGCPASLYEQRSNRILCPCHQSQFDALEYAKPIFGPAARALAQLPITVNNEGYLVAAGDFIEPVGPAFWERKS